MSKYVVINYNTHQVVSGPHDQFDAARIAGEKDQEVGAVIHGECALSELHMHELKFGPLVNVVVPKEMRAENSGCGFYRMDGYSFRGTFDANGDFRTLDGIHLAAAAHNVGHPQFATRAA